MQEAASRILDALSCPALARIASPALAAELASLVTPARPVELVLIALGQLARKAGIAARHGHAWSAEEIETKAFSFVERAEWPRGQEPRASVTYAPPDRGAAPAVPPPESIAAGYRGMIASLGQMGEFRQRTSTDPLHDLLAMVPPPRKPRGPGMASTRPPAHPPVSLDEFLPFAV